MQTLVPVLLMAIHASTPRLVLSLEHTMQGDHPTVAITLTLINDSAQSIDVPELEVIRPSVFDEQGKRVILSDIRDAAGLALPQIPEPPAEPIRPGRRQVLARYNVVRTGAGTYSCRVPFGGGQLGPGRYRFSVQASFYPVSKAAWMARYEAGAHREKVEPAAQAAARYDAHWAEVASFWSGALESNVLEVKL